MESKSTELFIGKREVSFYDAPIFNTTPKASLNLNQIYDLIKGDSYKRITEAVRGSSSKEIIKEIKSHRLDYVTFGGVFEKRANTSLQKASGYMAIDLDDLSEVEKVKQILLNDQMLDTVMLFTSPSGKGLKWIIHHDPRYEMEYGEYFDAVRNYLSDKYAIEVDKSGRDIARACFLCSDPDAIYHHLRSARCFNILNPNDWLKHSITINDQKKHSETFKEASGSDLKRKEALGSDFEAFESEHKVIESDELISQVEFVITQIEEKKVDLTENYDDWVKIGFGLARSLRERGRDYFHKISQYYPNYNASECNLKYDDCLKSKDQGVTIATFFSLAGLAGLEVFEESEEFHDGHHDAHNVGNDAHRAQNMNSLNGIERHRQEYDGIDRILPEIPDHVYNKLPKVLHGLCELFEKSEEKDLILLGSIATTSSVLPHVFGKYDTKTVYPNINLFITAPASAGKGVLSFCKRLVVPIHNQMREESKLQQVDYERQMNIYNITKKDNPDAEKPVKPPEKLLFIPANSSSTGVFQLLADNNGRGLIFETEGDTLSNTFKSEYGNYSDGFRKAFHHETISYYRRTERELVEIKEPMLS
ncbi:MAG: DUF3987 domain-containing protein, partial [Bacteroidetes bacterium]|nr:DUF3987 domain-containing protein [Bacteroidota bacterium]